MKLLNYSTFYFAGVLLLLLSAWAVIFYIEMLDEIYDSLDDSLENQKMLVIRKTFEDPSVLQQSEFEDGYYTIKETSFEEIEHFTDSYRDTLMYKENEKDYEPVRLLESVFTRNGKYYKLKVITSMVEEDDLVKDLFIALLWLYLGLIISILILNNLVLKKIWNPFYQLIGRLRNFRIEEDQEIQLEPTRVEEFKLLNESVEKLLSKSVQSYVEQKHFIENASHELQTPLAISINKLELLAENTELKEDQVKIVASVMDNLERLTRFNRSLLLLSKIENKQYVEEEMIDFNALINQIKNDFQDLAEHRNLKISIKEEDNLKFRMNKDLALIMVLNLLKNALIHGKSGSEIKILIQKRSFEVKNPGGEGSLEEEKIFNRFEKSNTSQRSTGLGLSITKAISEKYRLKLSYSYAEEQHIFRILFPER